VRLLFRGHTPLTSGRQNHRRSGLLSRRKACDAREDPSVLLRQDLSQSHCVSFKPTFAPDPSESDWGGFVQAARVTAVLSTNAFCKWPFAKAQSQRANVAGVQRIATRIVLRVFRTRHHFVTQLPQLALPAQRRSDFRRRFSQRFRIVPIVYYASGPVFSAASRVKSATHKLSRRLHHGPAIHPSSRCIPPSGLARSTRR